MAGLNEAERKLIFADFLLNREDTEPYLGAATRHILEAAKIAIKEFTNLGETEIESPQIIKQTFSKFEEKEPKQFIKYYLNFLQIVGKGTAKTYEVSEALRKTREFISWIKEQKFTKNL